MRNSNKFSQSINGTNMYAHGFVVDIVISVNIIWVVPDDKFWN